MTHPSKPSELLNAAIDSVNADLTRAAYLPVATVTPKIVRAVAILEAQLAILSEAHGYASDWENGATVKRGHSPEVIYAKELVLAQAILGGGERG